LSKKKDQESWRQLEEFCRSYDFIALVDQEESVGIFKKVNSFECPQQALLYLKNKYISCFEKSKKENTLFSVGEEVIFYDEVIESIMKIEKFLENSSMEYKTAFYSIAFIFAALAVEAKIPCDKLKRFFSSFIKTFYLDI
jgi:hypothetical protein